MSYVIVSAATKDSRYVECLEEQRRRHGSRFVGLVVRDRGSWGENTKIKPEALRTVFAQGAEVALWVDADCEVEAPYYLPEGSWDVGVIDNIHPAHVNRISAGFILFRNTGATDRFLRVWEQNMRHTKTDHSPLMRAISKSPVIGVEVKNVTDWLRGKHAINVYAPERGEVR